MDAETPEPTAAELIAARPCLAMHAMDGLLLEGVPLAAIADALGTPCWVYGAGTMRARLAALTAAMAPLGARIHYAAKANDHLAVLRLMRAGGAGADIVFSGVGKSAEDIRLALAEGVAQLNAESAEELATISAVATAMGRTASVALRVNPDVDAGTHAKITTGRADNKFGVGYDSAVELYRHAARLPGVAMVGIALHIGSQIGSLAPYRAAYARAAALVAGLREAGQTVDVVDCGGGFGIGYGDLPGLPVVAFAGVLRTAFAGLGVRLMVEPGRWLVGPAGVLLAGVTLVKHTGARRFVVLDAGMNDLVRPALYDAWHGIVPLSAVAARRGPTAADVVGPVCESGDTFARLRRLPPLVAGERVAILDAGAYGAVMSSTYNARPLAPIAMVDGERWEAIRARQQPAALWEGERIPGFVS